MKTSIILAGLGFLMFSGAAWGMFRRDTGEGPFSAVDHWKDPLDNTPNPIQPIHMTGVGFSDDAPRGIRNNNPGNIKHGSSNWQGMANVQPDSVFVTFSTVQYGIRALVVLLRNYNQRHGISTIRGIIQRWAPAGGENPHHENYVNYVAGVAGVSPDRYLTSVQFEQYIPAITQGIMNFESGEQWGMQLSGYISEGVALA